MHLELVDRSTETRSHFLLIALPFDPRQSDGLTDSELDRSCLGYISYYGTQEAGRVSIVNRNARITPADFEIGARRYTAMIDGPRGEGLLNAVRGMLDCQRTLHFDSCGLRMSFLYDTQGFIHRREEAIPTADQAGYPPGVPFTPSSYHDVGVVIGASNGSGEGSGSVSYESFIIWAERVPCLTSWSRQVRASLSSPSEEVAEAPVYPVVAEPDVPVKTPLGDLWPQTTNEGGIFYRGALVGADTELPQPDQTLNRGPMRYKYCISSDAYQRVYTESPPRSRVEEEGAVILQIWAYAVQEKPELIGNLSDMLMSLPDPDISYYQDVRLVRGDYCADVNTAEAHIDRATATLLQKHLLKKGNVWYYTAPEVAKVCLSHLVHGRLDIRPLTPCPVIKPLPIYHIFLLLLLLLFLPTLILPCIPLYI